MIALFFDTETTGFKSSTFTPEIVQIGALLQDTETKRVLAELNVIIIAKNPIPQAVSDIHGITDELSAKFGVESSVAEHLFSQLVIRADILVAHNIKCTSSARILTMPTMRWPMSEPVEIFT